ncbi:MAG: N-acetylmuramidase family protein, partial [Muribaculaceae bacterium]|nr:N-acetylmuramidase family protein [Muribaculaceae bacterium]
MIKTSFLTIALIAAASLTGHAAGSRFVLDEDPLQDSLDLNIIIIDGDTLHISFIPAPPEAKHIGPITDEDFGEIADDLGVEKAAIRAVVDIETGSTRAGFHDGGHPLINFDLPIFRRTAARHKINLAQHRNSEALASPNVRKYGSHQAAQQARLAAAMEIDSLTAIESTFWGMFQIGGFNWKLCGTASPTEFVELMSRSEYDQLRLFANFIRNTGLLKHLKAKNWAAFAKLYNGPSYASRGYHTRL